MPIATYQGLCIDAADPGRQTRFWAEVLRLEPHRRENGDGELRTPDGQVAVRVNGVPDSKAAKNRVHLDVQAASVQEALDAGATLVAEFERWTTLADPDGQEFCVFVRDEPIAQRLYELAQDCAEGPEPSHRQALWWQGMLGGDVVDDDRGYSWLEKIPSATFYSMDFVGVPEPKTVKNRVYLDVTTDDVEALVAHGATVLREPDDEIDWHVLADPDGNEFCASTGR